MDALQTALMAEALTPVKVPSSQRAAKAKTRKIPKSVMEQLAAKSAAREAGA